MTERVDLDEIEKRYIDVTDHSRCKLTYSEAKLMIAELRAYRAAAAFPDTELDAIEGCGDNSCLIAPPNGMGTNGGCRCLDGIPRGYTTERLRIQMALSHRRRLIATLRLHRAALPALRAMVKVLDDYDITIKMAARELIALRVEVEAHRARAAAVQRLVEEVELVIGLEVPSLPCFVDLRKALAVVKVDA